MRHRYNSLKKDNKINISIIHHNVNPLPRRMPAAIIRILNMLLSFYNPLIYGSYLKIYQDY